VFIKIKNFILRQYSVGNWWGAFRNVSTNVMSYVIFLNFILVAPLGYSTAVAPWLEAHGVPMPLIVFMGIIMIGLLLIFVLEYKLSIPSQYSFWSDQWWRHNNPLKEKMEKIDKKLDSVGDIDKRLKAIEEALGIEKHA